MSIKVRASRCVWGSHLITYPQSLSNIICDCPGGKFLPLSWYRWGTSTRNACKDLEVGQRSFCLPLIKKILEYFFFFSTKKIFFQILLFFSTNKILIHLLFSNSFFSLYYIIYTFKITTKNYWN